VVDFDGRALDRQIEWHDSPNRADRTRLDAACATVGPIVVAGARDGGDSPRAQSRDLIVVTWNVNAGGGNVRALIEDVTRQFPSAAVVLLLQDVYRAGSLVPAAAPAGAPVPRAVRPGVPWREDIVRTARDLDWHLVYVPSMRNGRGAGQEGAEDRGTAILSTLPVDAIAVIELPLARHRRAAVAATLSTGDDSVWRVRVASLHLDTVGNWRRLYLFSSQHRARQAAHVIDALGGSEPMLIGADLNTWADGPAEPAVARLLGAFPDTPRLGWQPTFQGIWRLDYFFFNLPDEWSARSWRLDRSFGSDHHPLIAEVRRPR
jgi:endonuclease/exonuclease/phosphatase family metal-dependent hydrolase